MKGTSAGHLLEVFVTNRLAPYESGGVGVGADVGQLRCRRPSISKRAT